MLAITVYALCTLTSLICTVLLLKAYFTNRAPLLLWSGLCFIALTINNALLIVDAWLGPHYDLSAMRLTLALIGLLLLVYGLIFET